MVIAIFFYLARPTKSDLNKTYDKFGAATKEKFDKLKEQFEKFKKFFDRSTEKEDTNIYIETEDEPGDISIKNLLTIEIPGKNDPDTDEKKSDKHSNEDVNEKTKEADVKVKEVDEEADEINEKALEIIEQIFIMIPDTSSSIIKDIFKGDIYKDSEISSDVQSKINEKMFEILRKISIKISQKSSDTCYVDNILSANISTVITFASDSKQTQLTTKINLLKEIKSPDIKRIIFAEIHIETAIILLRKLFDVLLEKFEDVTNVPKQISKAEEEMKENIPKISENIKKVLPGNSDTIDKTFSGIVNETEKVNKFANDLKISNKKDDKSNGKEKADDKKEKTDDEASKIVKKAEEMSFEISKKFKDEISKNIQEKIEEIFYKILNEVYYNIKMDDKPVTSNEGQMSSKKIQDDDKTDEPGQETYNKEQSFSENMQNDQSYDIKILDDEPVTSNEEQASSKQIQFDDKTAKQFSENIQTDQSIITYKINEIRNIFSKIKKEKIDIINKDENVLTKSLKDNLTKSLKEILTKEDSKDLDVEHIIFIICAILDSESLLFIDNISRDYTKKLKSHVQKSKHLSKDIQKNIKEYVKKFIVIRVLIEVICKNIPLLIIMAIYTSEIVVIGYMPIMALITSCLKFLSCFTSKNGQT
ncbi:8438_t:CDS:2 [Gigaspora margarita]|uniref:8438_t:CDS:1 n=1 Tax=Gigaspora margarita TaxID=4874 RepID=A0ABM8VZI4_GIGMA|nr:8438_t:CDS:2 [Gigaspora margarita]